MPDPARTIPTDAPADYPPADHSGLSAKTRLRVRAVADRGDRPDRRAGLLVFTSSLGFARATGHGTGDGTEIVPDQIAGSDLFPAGDLPASLIRTSGFFAEISGLISGGAGRR